MRKRSVLQDLPAESIFRDRCKRNKRKELRKSDEDDCVEMKINLIILIFQRYTKVIRYEKRIV